MVSYLESKPESQVIIRTIRNNNSKLVAFDPHCSSSHTCTGRCTSHSDSRLVVLSSTTRSSAIILFCSAAICVWMLASFLFMISEKALHSPATFSAYSHSVGNANLCLSKTCCPLPYIYDRGQNSIIEYQIYNSLCNKALFSRFPEASLSNCCSWYKCIVGRSFFILYIFAIQENQN